MNAPVLQIVPPTPHLALNPYPTPMTSNIDKYRISNEDLPRPTRLANGDVSNSLDTVTSNSTSTTNTSTGTGRSSSEKTAVNIYSMYGTTRESYISNGDTYGNGINGAHLPVRKDSEGSSEGYATPAGSPMDAIQRTSRQPTPSGSTSTPTRRTPTPTSRTNSSNINYSYPSGQGQLQTDGQIVESGRNSPAIFINPPPRRTSKHSLNSNSSSNANPLPQSQPPHHTSRNHPSTSSSSHARPSLSPTPTPLSSDRTTSATSSSAPSIPVHPLPSPLAPMAPAQGPEEDPDSYYVRATYAALDVSGVRGDGYEDGEELTRARLGAARGMLPSPSPDTATRKAIELAGGKELTEKERELLASVDRYGFFSPPSENRIIVLKSPPLKVKLSTYKVASSSASPSVTQLKSQPEVRETAEDRKKEDRRIAKWGRMLVPVVRDSGANVAKWGFDARKERKLEERVYKGIPDRWRTAAWFTLIEKMAKESSKKAGKEAIRAEMLGVQYRDVIDHPSTFDIQIDLDVPRTIGGHVMFKTRYGMGQRSMFHVLHAFSLHCTECGYCQGMGPLAATLLCYLEPEKVYTCLVRLHDNYDMHETFLPGFPGLLEAFYVQEKIMQRMLPGIYAVFKKNMISTTAYAVKWYITLFANTVTFQTQLRLWDVYFLEGKDLLILMAVAVIWSFKDNLLSSQASFETILELLSSFFVVEDEDALLNWLHKAMEDRRLRRDMQLWRDEWKELVRLEKDKDALL